jgi:hypothetical protein
MVEIDDEDDLLRRIFHYHLRPDGSISPAAFMTTSKKPAPELSVHLAWLTTPAQTKSGDGAARAGRRRSPGEAAAGSACRCGTIPVRVTPVFGSSSV